eukprot:222976_1
MKRFSLKNMMKILIIVILFVITYHIITLFPNNTFINEYYNNPAKSKKTNKYEMKYADIVFAVKYPDNDNLAYPINSDSLNLLNVLWDHRLMHDNSSTIRNEYNTNKVGMGNLLHRKKESLLWSSMANFNHILPNSTVCEIGYAFGFSAIVILNSNPFVKYIGFDIGLPFSKNSWNIMENIYPDRARIFWGDSSPNILNLFNDNETDIVCDVWIIDGAHAYGGVIKDINAILSTSTKLTRKYPNNLLIFDDCNLGEGDIDPLEIDSVIINKSWPLRNVWPGYTTGPTHAFTETVMDKNSGILYVHHGNERDSHNRGIYWCIAVLNNSLFHAF